MIIPGSSPYCTRSDSVTTTPSEGKPTPTRFLDHGLGERDIDGAVAHGSDERQVRSVPCSVASYPAAVGRLVVFGPGGGYKWSPAGGSYSAAVFP